MINWLFLKDDFRILKCNEDMDCNMHKMDLTLKMHKSFLVNFYFGSDEPCLENVVHAMKMN